MWPNVTIKKKPEPELEEPLLEANGPCDSMWACMLNDFEDSMTIMTERTDEISGRFKSNRKTVKAGPKIPQDPPDDVREEEDKDQTPETKRDDLEKNETREKTTTKKKKHTPKRPSIVSPPGDQDSQRAVSPRVLSPKAVSPRGEKASQASRTSETTRTPIDPISSIEAYQKSVIESRRRAERKEALQRIREIKEKLAAAETERISS